ncbi:hypothetical protein RvY_15075 [Ramazzottius varieornatus]|uniref:Uncharacterized protein n=1 Tax=Ramazzottius varieornatus TaxID=947166 RepID=A0A1D1VX63_RAMVA|nr:hypothetical protein RvY_15075 [Ramazzottius varieornatus]
MNHRRTMESSPTGLIFFLSCIGLSYGQFPGMPNPYAGQAGFSPYGNGNPGGDYNGVMITDGRSYDQGAPAPYQSSVGQYGMASAPTSNVLPLEGRGMGYGGMGISGSYGGPGGGYEGLNAAAGGYGQLGLGGGVPVAGDARQGYGGGGYGGGSSYGGSSYGGSSGYGTYKPGPIRPTFQGIFPGFYGGYPFANGPYLFLYDDGKPYSKPARG